MTEEQGLSPQSVRSHCWKTSEFLTWFGKHHRLLVRVNVEDVDEFLAMKGAAGWNRKSVSVAAQALRAFFRFAETRGWCATGLAKAIQSPRIYQYEDLPEGPTRKVQQLLHSVKGTDHAALRTRAILMLFSVYGLRSGEVSRLLLSDFDWRQEVFVVNHSKRGGSQRYPLQHEVSSILHYLENRPGVPADTCLSPCILLIGRLEHQPYGWPTFTNPAAAGLRFQCTAKRPQICGACATSAAGCFVQGDRRRARGIEAQQVGKRSMRS